MKKVITYGTYDLLHYGHLRLLERAKALGDYLIVGVTSDDFDRGRGKINVQQSFMERVEAVRETGLADEIIAEEYMGQKIDDIKRYGVDIFAIGSDWKGHFDYLNEYCKVVYLERTAGVSSSELRSEKREVRLGMIGNYVSVINKFLSESKFVNGLGITGVCCTEPDVEFCGLDINVYSNYEDLLKSSDAIYIASAPDEHYSHIKKALKCGKHVLCESPVTTNPEHFDELVELAKSKKCVLMDSIKTAYSMAYSRLLLLAKSGIIGNILSVDSTCTSMKEISVNADISNKWNSICAWGPTALLPVFQLLGTKNYTASIISHMIDPSAKFDGFTKVSLVFPHAVASVKVGQMVKSEGDLVISGSKGYIYVPAPWWKTDYYEVRFEDSEMNKRYFYKLDGEGIRYELVSFVKAINEGQDDFYVNRNVSHEICNILSTFSQGLITNI